MTAVKPTGCNYAHSEWTLSRTFVGALVGSRIPLPVNPARKFPLTPTPLPKERGTRWRKGLIVHREIVETSEMHLLTSPSLRRGGLQHRIVG